MITINPPLPVVNQLTSFQRSLPVCDPCHTNCFAQPIRCQLSHVQLMPIFSRLAQQNSTSYSSLRGTKSHPTLPYYCLILSARFLKVLYMRSFLLLKNLRSCLYFLQSYELLIFVVYTLNQLAIVKKIWQKRGGLSTEGNHRTRHPNMLVHLVTLGLILIIKLIKV